MLGWVLTFLVIALMAGALGFSGLAGAAAGIASILFWVFLILFLVSLVISFTRKTVPPPICSLADPSAPGSSRANGVQPSSSESYSRSG